MLVTDEASELLEESSIAEIEEHQPVGGLLTGVFSVCNTTIGGGLLALPWVMKEAGLAISIFLLLMVAVMSVISARLLVRTSLNQFGKASSYRALSQKAFGKIGPALVESATCLFLLGALCGYIVIIGDLLPAVLTYFSGAVIDRLPIQAIVTLGILLPLSCTPLISHLKYTNLVAVAGILFLLFAVVFRGCQTFANEGVNGTQIVWAGNSQGVLASVPVLTFAFVFHPNLFPIWNELIDPTEARVNLMTNVAQSTNTFIYVVVALFGYLSFLENTEGNILKNYDDALFAAVKLMYSLVIAFSFPILHFPVRGAVERVLFSGPTHIFRSALVAFLCVGVAFGIAVIPGTNIDVIFGYFGATAGSAVVYGFPAWFYIGLYDPDDDNPTSLDSTDQQDRKWMFYFKGKKILVWLYLLVAVVLGVLGVVQITLGLTSKAPTNETLSFE